MKVLLLIAALALVALSVEARLTVDQANDPTYAFDQFQTFMGKFNRKYASISELNKKFTVFQANLKIAAGLNTKDEHADYGVTKFMDMSPSEFRAQYLLSNFTSPKLRGEPYPVLPRADRSLPLPESFDWRNAGVVTGVYNQGQCGSCWAFSTTENIESMWARAGRGLTNLAMQQLVDCDHNGDYGCGGGNPPNAYAYLIGAGGQDSYSSYPYTGENGVCQFNPGNIAARIRNWGYITTVDNENEMGAWTYQNGPPSICVDAQYWQYYNGGVITTNCGTSMDHCVQLIGWTTFQGIPAWTVRNSWGTNWGYSGYLYVMRGADVCLIGNEVTSSVI